MYLRLAMSESLTKDPDQFPYITFLSPKLWQINFLMNNGFEKKSFRIVYRGKKQLWLKLVDVIFVSFRNFLPNFLTLHLHVSKHSI